MCFDSSVSFLLLWCHSLILPDECGHSSVRAIDISVYMVSCNMIGRGKSKTKKFGREELGRPRPCERKCERRPYCNATTSP